MQTATTPSSPAKFGTMTGVFVPTLLTILGVIMYLREGWVVGNAGVLGTWLIITISFVITATTALSLSSIVTNIRIGAGGAFSIIAQSLGLEIAGSIGLPLYLAQTFAVAMYVFGFRSGWLWIFPNYDPLVVDLVTFALVFAIAWLSARFAFRIQYIIFAIIILSLVSVAGGLITTEHLVAPTWWGEFPGSPEEMFAGTGFWTVFAVFFPAATGIMAGANMSGDLASPRKSIPIGTLGAIAVSYVIYMLLALWFGVIAFPQELVEDYNLMIGKSFWGPIVVAGLLGATLSSAISSLVGAPRILQAMGNFCLLPKCTWFAHRSADGEPRNALIFTASIALITLLLRDLNVIAPLITMFFLITYAMINGVMLLEQGLKLPTFRPTFRIPLIIPVIGSLGCIFAMLVTDAVFAFAAFCLILLAYGGFALFAPDSPFGDMRRGLFIALAEWAIKQTTYLPKSIARSWKPNVLFPVRDAAAVEHNRDMLEALVFPEGCLYLLHFTPENVATRTQKTRVATEVSIQSMLEKLRKDGIIANAACVTTSNYHKALYTALQVKESSFIPPNIVFFSLPKKSDKAKEFFANVQVALENGMGVILSSKTTTPCKTMKKETIRVWVTPNSKTDWQYLQQLRVSHLALLAAVKFQRNLGSKILLTSVVADEERKAVVQQDLEHIIELTRIPASYEIIVTQQPFAEVAKEKSEGIELHLFGMGRTTPFSLLWKLITSTNRDCIFVSDSGSEDAWV